MAWAGQPIVIPHSTSPGWGVWPQQVADFDGNAYFFANDGSTSGWKFMDDRRHNGGANFGRDL